MDVTFDAALNRSSDQDGWAERCIYWNKLSNTDKPKRKRREKQSRPMVLTGHGLSSASTREGSSSRTDLPISLRNLLKPCSSKAVWTCHPAS